MRNRLLPALALFASLCSMMIGGCATSRQFVVTNTTQNPVELSREIDGGSETITLAPGGRTTIAGNRLNFQGVLIEPR